MLDDGLYYISLTCIMMRQSGHLVVALNMSA